MNLAEAYADLRCMSNKRYCFTMKHNQATATPLGTIAGRVSALRKQRGLSAARLAQEMTNAGVPWERIVVSNLETGRRQSLSITEWLALAYVLDVSPLTLLLPAEDADYKVTPERTAPASVVGAWLMGPHALPVLPDLKDVVAHPGDNFARQHQYFAEWPAYLRRPLALPEVQEQAAELNKRLTDRHQEVQRLLDEAAAKLQQLQAIEEPAEPEGADEGKGGGR